MTSIVDRPPPELDAEFHDLHVMLDQRIPAKQLDRNLLIATWNLRAFGGLTEKWAAGARDVPKRDLHALRCIAAIISKFDVVALQEVRGDLKALRHMLKLLNQREPNWGLILTDVTRGTAGNDERMAFVFDTRRAKPSGLACELVVPEDRSAIGQDAFNRQFARTPYAVSFLSSDKTFILVTLHVLYGQQPRDRVGELTAIAEWLADWARQVNSWHHNLIALGDFNIDRIGDPLYQAFTSSGLTTPAELNEVPRTLFGSSTERHYDQIAWFAGAQGVPRLSLRYSGNAGSFDFARLVHQSLTREQISWRISDHYPLWVEFDTRFA